jgi:Cd2+/Zn2+-exporting ATPase
MTSAININLPSSPNSPKLAPPPAWQSLAFWEPRLVAITAVAIVAAWLGGQAGAGSLFELLCGLVAFAAGGIVGAKNALKSLFTQRKIDVDMLMILAALGAASVGSWQEGAILLFLFSLSNVLQDYAIGRSRRAIQSLFKLYPEQATVKRGEETLSLKISEIVVGDLVLIRPGERIPVDGTVRSGSSSVDESPITGESMPVDKVVGAQVFAGTLNKQGILDVEALKPANQGTLARIIKMVEEAQDSKAKTERFLDKFEQYYAMFIIGMTFLFVVVPPLFLGADFSTNFYRAMVLMTVASPCALVISVPAAFISAIASAARGGILLKGGAYIEDLAKLKVIAFDKTGTLTMGEPRLTDITSLDMPEDELLSLVASVESRSEHPVAHAVVKAAQERQLTIQDPEDFEGLAGIGLQARLGDKHLLIGRVSHLEKQSPLPPKLFTSFEQFEQDGKTTMGILINGAWAGIFAVADQLRPQAADAVRQLRALGVQVAMLTGDNPRVAQNIAQQVGIERVYAGLLPQDKVTQIQALKDEFKDVAMVGDGVNDAPALALASVGIAMGAAGTDVAMETADVVLMGDKLERIADAIKLARKAQRVVWQNISFSLFVIVALVISTFVINLPLPLGVLGHEGSTVIVVLNGLITLLILPEIQRRRQATKSDEKAPLATA